MSKFTNTYWNSNGRFQSLVEHLQKLVPIQGEVKDPRKNKALEKFRRASNCYYDLYNNGLGNRAREFAQVFKIPSSHYKEPWRGYGCYRDSLYELMEQRMDEIILAAHMEQAGVTR